MALTLVWLPNNHAYVQPNGNVGVAKFRFVWFDVDQPNDSDWVDIMFDTTPGAGIGENTAAVRTFSAYPTPALQGRVDLRFDLVNGGASRTDLVLYSVLGTEVRRVRLTGTSGTVTVEQGDLGAGLYFANLEADGRPIATRRIVFGSR
ncbi:MAG: T9SS type A sorting domain-containing protein [Flavobacteriales bacterium]|nr:T9SS type A sorting domain-containing protein [Flavobacteriales bacterium]